jgi:hypothetical protein
MRIWLSTIFVFLVVGCSSQPALELAPVKGRVSLAGKSLVQTTIQLIPDEKKGTAAPSGLGQSDEEGRFQITTPPHGEGAVPGHYKVTVTSFSGNVPQRYADPVKTPLSVEIPGAGLDNWTLELTSP